MQGRGGLFHVEHFTFTYCLTFRLFLVEFAYDEKALFSPVDSCFNDDLYELLRLYADE